MNDEKLIDDKVVEETSILERLDKYIEDYFQFPPGVDNIKELRERMLDQYLKEQGIPIEEIEQTKTKIMDLIKAENEPTNRQTSTIRDLPPGAEY
jgi:phage terminase large subunit-like protein